MRDAFALVYPKTKLRVEGVEVESGVSCQVRRCVNLPAIELCRVSSARLAAPPHHFGLSTTPALSRCCHIQETL